MLGNVLYYLGIDTGRRRVCHHAHATVLGQICIRSEIRAVDSSSPVPRRVQRKGDLSCCLTTPTGTQRLRTHNAISMSSAGGLQDERHARDELISRPLPNELRSVSLAFSW
jgi:hypothetical protein